MVQFETYIFEEFYTLYDKLSDPNKDLDGKGTQERFTEVWGQVIDEIVPYIEDMGANIVVPTTRLDAMVWYAEKELGYSDKWIWFFLQPIAFRKNLVGIMPTLYTIRYTRLCMEVMFAWIGCTMVLTEDFVYEGGFDSPLLLDSPQRTFDSFTNSLIEYDVALNGNVGSGGSSLPYTLPFTLGGGGGLVIPIYPATPSAGFLSFIQAVYTILLFNQPINGTLRSLTYNGTDIKPHLGYIDPSYLRVV